MVLVVFHRLKEKAPRGGGRACKCSIVGGKNCGDVVELDVAARDVEHGADQVAHHVVKESVAADAINEQAETVGGLLVPRGRVDGAYGGTSFNPIDEDLWLRTPGVGLNHALFSGLLGAGCEIGIGGGETAKVVFADEGSGGRIESGEIQRPREGIDVAREERRTDLMAGGLDGENAVLVGFGDGGVSGVKGALYRLRP